MTYLPLYLIAPDQAGAEALLLVRSVSKHAFHDLLILRAGNYLLQQGDEIAGMAILAIEEGDEAAIINIVGKVDLSQLERLGEALDIPHLSRPPEPTDEEESDP